MNGATRRATGWLLAAIFAAVAIPALPASAAQMSCAEYSLSRDDIAHAQAAARPALPRSVRLEVNFACWNPDDALVDLETPRVLTPEGVQQWWAISCQRDDSTWTCHRPEFKQSIGVRLAVGDHSRAVELSFGQEIALARARVLAAQALEFYLDTESGLRNCSTIEDGAKRAGGLHHNDNDKGKRPAEPFHVNVIRDGLMDSVWLNDVGVIISFDPQDEQTPCWRDVVTAN